MAQVKRTRKIKVKIKRRGCSSVLKSPDSASRSLNGFAPGPSQRYQPFSSSSQQSHTTTSQLISRLSAPISVSSTTSSASMGGLNPEELRVMRTVSQAQENAKIVQEVVLLDRISDHGHSLLDRMTDQPSAKWTSVH